MRTSNMLLCLLGPAFLALTFLFTTQNEIVLALFGDIGASIAAFFEGIGSAIGAVLAKVGAFIGAVAIGLFSFLAAVIPWVAAALVAFYAARMHREGNGAQMTPALVWGGALGVVAIAVLLHTHPLPIVVFTLVWVVAMGFGNTEDCTFLESLWVPFGFVAAMALIAAMARENNLSDALEQTVQAYQAQPDGAQAQALETRLQAIVDAVPGFTTARWILEHGDQAPNLTEGTSTRTIALPGNGTASCTRLDDQSIIVYVVDGNERSVRIRSGIRLFASSVAMLSLCMR